MNAEERVKNKSDKLARQSMALLERLKSKKEKVAIQPNQENYMDDLYLKVFSRCSPHFDKMATSDELFAEHRRNITCIEQLNQDLQESAREKQDLKVQLGKLKQSSDDSAKMKALNIQLNRLQLIKEESTALIKTLRKENQSLAYELQQLQQEHHKITELNKELEVFVESIANDVQSQKRNEAEQQARSEVEGQAKAELLKANCEVQTLRHQLLQAEQRLTVMNHQNTMLKSNLQQVERDGQEKLQQERMKLQQERMALQQKIMTIQQERLNLHQQNTAQMNLANEQITNYQSKLAILEKALQEMGSQLKSIGNECESLKVTNDRLKAQIDGTTKTKQQLQANLVRQRNLLHDKQEESLLSQEQNAQLCQSLKRYTEEAQKLQAMLDSYTQTNQKLVNRNQQLEQDLVDLGNKLSNNQENLTAKLQEFKERLKFFKENNETLNNQKVDYISNIELLADEVKNLTEQIANKDQELGKLREEYNQAVAVLNKEKSGREQQLQTNLIEVVKRYQESIQKKQAQYSSLKQQYEKYRISSIKLEQQINKQIVSQKQQLIRTQTALETFANQQQELQQKIKGQFDRIQKLQLQKYNLQSLLQQQTEQYNQDVTALQPQLQQFKERLDVIKEERDQLSQQKITLRQENEKMNEANNKLRSEVNERKLKIHKNEQKICELNQIINNFPKNNTNYEQQQIIVQNKQMSDQIEEKVQSKCNKHIETINQLSSELTEAYKMIQQLQHTVSQLKVKTQIKSEKNQRGSVEKKERGKSIKKIAGIFGF